MTNKIDKIQMPDGQVLKLNGGSGLEVGDIGMALYIDETKGLRRYLNGQIVDINTNTQAFLNRLLEIKNTNPDYFTTEENWQSEALLNIDGCVYKFVLNYSGETVVSVRLPKYPDYVEINAGGTLPVVGNGITLGLTNGTANFGLITQGGTRIGNADYSTTAFNKTVGSNATFEYSSLNENKNIGVTTDPTKSGLKTTLNQTKLKMRYFIQIATGSETEANIVNTLENVNGFTLLESKYSDKPLYNECWLLSNGQYNPKGTYPTAYEGLQVEYNTEIEVGTTVTLPSGVSYTKRGLSVKLSTETYTDYDFVLNTADETFRLPLSNNQRFVIETGNGYRIWSDGYCHQWGNAHGNGVTVSLLKTLKGTDYHINLGGGNSANWAVAPHSFTYYNVTASSFQIRMEEASALSDGMNCNWDVYGYLAEGEYTPQKLYFYVGDIDQNHGIVNMGRIGEQLATKTDMLQASGASMPSSRYINLIMGSSGSTYTMPADGWLCIRANHTGQAYYNIGNNTSHYEITESTYTNYGNPSGVYPVKKGDIITISYGGVTEWIIFRFIYAEGAQ